MRHSRSILVFAIFAALLPTTGSGETTYLSKDLSFKAHDQVDLFGRLILPKEGPPRAIVLAVQTAEGSTVDLKRPLAGGKTFNYYDLYRDHLTARKIGFFSYEGRGIRMGDEPPRYERIDWEVYNTSTLANKVQDVLSAIAIVRSEKDLRKTPIILLGTSEGTLLAAEAAASKPKEVAGLALYGVLVTNLRETFRYIMSGGEFLKYRSFDSDKNGIISKAEWEAKVKEVPFAKGDLNEDGSFTVDDIKVATKSYLDAIDQDDYAVLQDWAKKAAAVAVPKDWFKDHFSHPANSTFLAQLKMPVGLFHGDADRMTPIGEVKKLEARAKKSGQANMEFHYFEGADHSLRVGRYFVNGKLTEGHRAILDFVDRISPKR